MGCLFVRIGKTNDLHYNDTSLYSVCVAALILEEIAIDSHNKPIEDRLLQEAQDLHLQSLALAKKAFGEDNVQTAKHYGNLGRLYQSMHRYAVSGTTSWICNNMLVQF